MRHGCKKDDCKQAWRHDGSGKQAVRINTVVARQFLSQYHRILDAVAGTGCEVRSGRVNGVTDQYDPTLRPWTRQQHLLQWPTDDVIFRRKFRCNFTNDRRREPLQKRAQRFLEGLRCHEVVCFSVFCQEQINLVPVDPVKANLKFRIHPHGYRIDFRRHREHSAPYGLTDEARLRCIFEESRADCRVQTVCSDYQIVATRRPTVGGNLNAIVILVELGEGYAEPDIDR